MLTVVYQSKINLKSNQQTGLLRYPPNMKVPTQHLFNLSKPNGYVMYHQFNIQQLYALPTLYLCVLYLSQNKKRLVPLTA